MDVLEYKIKLTGDYSEVKEMVAKTKGELRQLKDNEYLIKLNYDGNYKQFNKVVKDIASKMPEIQVQFEYDMNKKALDAMKKKLSDLEVFTDTSKATKELTGLSKQIDAMYKQMDNLDLSSPEYSKLEDSLESLENRALQAKKNLLNLDGGENAFNKLDSQIKEIINDIISVDDKKIKLISKDDIQNAEKFIHEAEQNLERLKKLGAVDLDTSESSEDLEKLEKHLYALEEELSKKKSLNLDLTDTLNQIDELIEKINSIPNHKEIEIKVRDYSNVDNLRDPSGTKEVLAYRAVNSVYGGTYNQDRGTFFSSKKSLAEQYADKYGGNKVYQSKLKFKNAFEIDGNYQDHGAIEYLGYGYDEASKKILACKDAIVELESKISNSKSDEEIAKFNSQLDEQRKIYKEISDDVTNMYGTHSTDGYVRLAKQNGYDGVILHNIYDGFNGDGKNNPEDLSDLFVPFYEDQISEAKVVSGTINGISEAIKDIDTSNLTVVEEKLEKVSSSARKVNEQINLSANQNGLSSVSPTQRFDDEIQQPPSSSTEKTEQEIKEVSQAFEQEEQVAKSSLTSEENILLSLIDSINKVIESVDNKTRAFQEEGQVVDTVVQEEINNLETLSKYLLAIMDNVENLGKEFKGIDFSFDNNVGESELVKFADKLSEIKDVEISTKLDNIGNSLKEFSNVVNGLKIQDDNILLSINNLLKNSDKIKQLSTLVNIPVAKTTKEGSINNGDVQNKYNQLIAKKTIVEGELSAATARNDQAVINASEKRLSVINEEIEKLKQLGQVDEEVAKQSQQNINAQIKASEKLEKANEAQSKREAANLNRQSKLVKDFSLWLSSNSAATRAYSSEIESIFAQLRNSGELTAEQLNAIQQRIDGIMATAAKEGKTGMSFIDTLKQRAKSLAAYLATFTSFYDIIRYVREGINTVKEYDTALTEMRKVSDESISTLKEYAATTFDVGDAVGATALTIQKSTADWQRLGETLNDAKESAKVSNILLNVSEFENVNDATDALVSASQAYKDLDKIEIVDKLNNIGNNFSISTDQLAQGLQNTAAVLKTQGNDIDEALALLTAANSQVQDISKASMGVRTISLRISGTEEAKGELASLGEDVDDFIVQTRSKTQKLIKDYTATASNAYKGIDVLDANGNLRDTYEILLDISKIYTEIQEEDKKAGTNRANALIEYLAGKTRANIAASILSAPDMLEEVYKSSQVSQGSANEELDKYLDSIEGKLTQTTNKMHEFANIVVNSDSIKDLLDLLNGVLGAINAIAATPLAPILLGGGTGAVAFAKSFKELESIGRVTNAGNIIDGVIGDVEKIEAVDKAIKNLSLSEAAELLVKKGLTDEEYVNALARKVNSKEAAMQAINSAKVSAAETIETATTISLSNAIKGLAISMKAFATSTLGILTIGAALGYGLYKIYDLVNVSYEEHKEKLDEAQKSYTEAKSEVESLQKQLGELNSKIKEINEQDTISLSDEEDLKNLVAETKELQRQLNIAKERAKYEGKKAEQEAVDTLQAKQVSKYRDAVSESGNYTKGGMVTSREELEEAINASDKYRKAVEDLQNQKDNLESKGIFSGTEWDQTNNELNYFQRLLDDADNDVISLAEDLQKQSDSLIGATKEGDQLKSSVEDSLSLYDDWYNRVNNVNKAFDSLSEKEQKQVLINKLADKGYDYEKITKVVNNLSSDSFKTISDNFSDFENQIDKTAEKSSDIDDLTRSISDFVEEVDKLKNDKIEIIDFSEITAEVNNFASAQSTLNTALSQQKENGTITEETLASLKEQYEGVEKAIELTSDGIIINSEKLRQLNAEQRQNIADELAKKEEELAKQYGDETEKLAVLTESKRLNLGVTDSEINAQQQVVDGLDSQIADLKILQKEYQNSISTHNAFMQALSSTNEGAGYEAITSSLEKVQEQWDKGLIGTDDIRTFVDYMTSTDMSNASVDDITAKFDEAMKSAKEFFTEGSSGSQKFIDLLANTTVEVDGVSKALAEYNAATDTWDINIDDMAQASEATGYSVDFLIDNLNRLKDYGFSVEFGETDEFINYQDAIRDVNKEISETEVLLAKSGGKSKELKDKLNDLNQVKVNLKNNLQLDIFDTAVNKVQELQTQISHLEGVGAPTQAIEAKKKHQGEIAESVGMTVQEMLEIDTSSADSVMDAWKKKTEKEPTTVTINADVSKAEAAINSVANKTYTSDLVLKLKLTGKSTVKRVINNIFDKIKGGKNDSGGTEAFGTAQFGNAYADGKIGYDGNMHNVMIGEVAPEMVVDPHNATYTIYSQPTMLKTLPKNAIVFNGKQTSDIIKHGTTPNYGKAYANGTKTGFAFSTSYNKSSGKTIRDSKIDNSDDSSTKKKKKQDKKTKQLIDWIERRINVLNTKAERWANIIEKATNPKRLGSYYNKLDIITKKQIKTYGDAYNRYMTKASTVKLSTDLKNKVKSKDLALFDKKGNLKSQKELIKKYGEKTYNKIQDYQTWYDKAISAIDNFTESAYKLANSPLEKASDKIELLSKALDELTATADNISIDNYKKANTNLDEQTKNAEKQRDAQLDALTETAKQLSGKSKNILKDSNLQISGKGTDIDGKNQKVRKANIDAIKKAVESGQEIDLTMYKLGSSGYKAAVKYNAALKANIDATHEAKLAEEEYIKTQRENYKKQFDNIEEYYDKQVELKQIQEDSVARQVDLIETKGMTVSKKYYESQISYEKQKRDKLRESKAELEAQLTLIPQGSSEWYDANKALDDVKKSIDDCTKSTVEFGNQITAVADALHNKVRDELSRISNAMSVVSKAWEKYDMFNNETGMFTNEGKATLGIYVTGLNTAIAKYQKDAQVLNELKVAFDKRPDKWESTEGIEVNGRLFYSKEQLYDELVKYTEYYNSDYTEALENENNIIDTIIQKYQKEAEVLKRVVDEKKNSLQADQDLYNWQRQVQDTTKNIGILEKQISALSGDNSEEGTMRRQKLQSQLDDANQDLKDQEREKYISDMQDMLDEMYDHYETELENEMKNRDKLLTEGLTVTNNNLTEIKSTIDKYDEKHNYNDVLGYVRDGINAMNTNGISVSNMYSLPSNLLTNVETKLDSIILAINNSNNGNGTQSNSGSSNNTSQGSTSTPTITTTTNSGVNNLLSGQLTDWTRDKGSVKKSDIENIFANSKYFAKGKKKKASDYKTQINKHLFAKDGKVLSDAGLDALCKLFNTTNDNLYNILMDYSHKYGDIANVKGFSGGGIGKLVKPNNEDGIAWVRNGEGFVAPEDVKHIQELLTVIPDVTNMLKPFSTLDIQKNNTNSPTTVEANYTFNLEDCTNAQDIIRCIQTDRNVRRALEDVTINQLNGTGSRLSVNRF